MGPAWTRRKKEDQRAAIPYAERGRWPQGGRGRPLPRGPPHHRPPLQPGRKWGPEGSERGYWQLRGLFIKKKRRYSNIIHILDNSPLRRVAYGCSHIHRQEPPSRQSRGARALWVTTASVRALAVLGLTIHFLRGTRFQALWSLSKPQRSKVCQIISWIRICLLFSSFAVDFGA